MGDSSKSREETVLQGVAASPGVAHGPAFVYLRTELEVPFFQVPEAEREEEIERFEQALLTTRSQIMRIRGEVAEKLGEKEAAIFDAHLMVLDDKALIEEVIHEMNETGSNIDFCFKEVSNRYIEAFANFEDDYLKERAMDIKDVARRLLRNMLGKSEESIHRLSYEHILVCEDLTPSDTSGIEKGRVLAVVTDTGGPTSHAVIMARSIEVPAVVGLHGATQSIDPDDIVLVDGYDGTVVINPTEQTLFKYGRLQEEKDRLKRVFRTSINLPAATNDGVPLKLLANIEGLEDAERARSSGAAGVGLFRTEAIFLRGQGFPSEEEQYVEYRKVVESLSPMPVTIRTFDLGGDKVLFEGMLQAGEENPFMGFRAIRFCLKHIDLFKQQLRAILRAASHGNAKIMYPMISSPAELEQANDILRECMQELKEKGIPHDPEIEVGCMIEVPSAAHCADILAESADFFSIGTNDLIQYMFAADRVNDKIAHLYDPNHPAVVRVLRHIIEVANRFDVPVSICGEMGGDPVFTALLFGLGADEISAVPASLPEIKYLIQHMNFDAARELAVAVLESRDSAVTKVLLKEFYEKYVGDAVKGKQPG